MWRNTAGPRALTIGRSIFSCALHSDGVGDNPEASRKSSGGISRAAPVRALLPAKPLPTLSATSVSPSSGYRAPARSKSAAAQRCPPCSCFPNSRAWRKTCSYPDLAAAITHSGARRRDLPSPPARREGKRLRSPRRSRPGTRPLLPPIARRSANSRERAFVRDSIRLAMHRYLRAD